MPLQTLGRASALSTFRRKEAVAKALTDRNVYSGMVEDKAVEVLNDGNSLSKM